MVNRACSSDYLVSNGSSIPQFLHALQRNIHYVFIAFTSKRNSFAKPIIFSKFEYFVEGQTPPCAFVLEIQLGWLELSGRQITNITLGDCLTNREPIYPFTLDLLAVSPQGCSSKTGYFSLWEMPEYLLPT